MQHTTPPRVYEFEKTFDAFTPGEFEVGIVNGTRFQGRERRVVRDSNNELTQLAESGQFARSQRA